VTASGAGNGVAGRSDVINTVLEVIVNVNFGMTAQDA
jgi:hypothetical protein